MQHPSDLAPKQAEPIPIERIRHSVSRILRDHNVGTGPGARVLSVSVNNARDRQELLTLSANLRAQGPHAAKAADWLLLGDGLCAAGCFPEADAVLSTAASVARSDNDVAPQAEAHFKRFRTRCELGDFNEALVAYGAAVALAAEVYALFPRRYEAVGILGAGGFGTVFRCRDTRADNAVVAVKALHGLDQVRDTSEVFAEARILKGLKHPHIIGIEHWDYADLTHERRPYLVLEYFHGHSLEVHLRNGSLPVPAVLAIGRLVAEAMLAAHAKHVLHRDLKPGNILVRQEGDTWDVRVVDFGLAVPLASARVSVSVPSAQRSLRDESFAGTLRYAPPEQRGELTTPVGPYSDVYSFGKTLIEALLGTTEPVSRNWRALPDDVRDPLRELLEDCINAAPKERHPTFAPVLAGLAAIDPEAERAAERRAEAVRAADRKCLEDEAARQRAEKERRDAEARAGEARRLTPGKVVALPLTSGLDIEFAYIPPGEFLMGSPESEKDRESNEKQHPVRITQGFWMGVCPITQAQWLEVMGTNPSYFSRAGGVKERVAQISAADLARFPVEQVSWDMATEFCTKLSERLGKRVTLPTEAQWEYACRAGTTTPFHFGSALNGDWANCNGNYPYGTEKKGRDLDRPTPVGLAEYPANVWNLRDLHGNVWEWCQDAYREDYEKLLSNDPLSEQVPGSRVLRGGSWCGTARRCRAALRRRNAPGCVYRDVGLRVCCRLD